jgi:predicted regulator of amino acid metabolism with ACT domain
MWSIIKKYFEDYPERLKVVRILIDNGLNIRNGKIFLNEIEIPIVRIARVANVDRRTVIETISMIEEIEELRRIFYHLRSAGHSLKEVARYLNFGVLEIVPENARIPGILANAAMILANHGLSIRQAIVDDPELSPEPRLVLIVEKKIPGELISEFLKIKGVAKVSIY